MIVYTRSNQADRFRVKKWRNAAFAENVYSSPEFIPSSFRVAFTPQTWTVSARDSERQWVTIDRGPRLGWAVSGWRTTRQITPDTYEVEPLFLGDLP